MSKEIIDAAASYFGMDPADLAQGTMAAGANGLRFTFTVEVGADDYMGIADRMRAMRGPVGPQDDPDTLQYTTLPSLQEVMRNPVAFMDRPECEELLYRAQRASKAVRENMDVERDRREQAAQGVVSEAQRKVFDVMYPGHVPPRPIPEPKGEVPK